MKKPKGVIYNTTVIQPTLIGRLRILFGATITWNLETVVSEEVEALYSKSYIEIEFEKKNIES